MPHDIIALPAFTDNYIWVIIHRESKNAVIIDPGDAEIAVNALKKYDLKLSCILITHHHWDHTGGVAALKKHYKAPVYGPDNPGIPEIDHYLIDGTQLELPALTLKLKIIATPGHTNDHISYYNNDMLFCGDTLFSAGCGRLFEGSATQLYQSLTNLTKLSPNIAVYCAHEYTVDNLKFSLAVEPENPDTKKYLEQMIKKRDNNIVTLPSSIAIEQKINPFLRCEQKTVHTAAEHYAKKKLHDAIEVFAVLRKWKDCF